MNVDANNLSAASADADINANIKTLRIIHVCGCEYSVHLYCKGCNFKTIENFEKSGTFLVFREVKLILFKEKF